MSFKAQVAKDITGVFINPSEFAEEHDVDGQLVNCVVDDDIIQERTGGDQSMEYDGVFATEKMLYIEETFFTRRPIEGQRIYLDGDLFSVKRVASNMGVLEIELRQDST